MRNFDKSRTSRRTAHLWLTGLLMAGVATGMGLAVSQPHDAFAVKPNVRKTRTPTATAGPVTATPTATATSTATATATTTATTTGHAIKTVFVIVEENHNWSSIKGSASAPYINNTLLPMAAHAEAYMNPPGNHPSEPNYLWLEAGTNFGVTNDNPPSSNSQSTTAHLVTLLNNAGISWRSYQENISGTTCPLTDSSPYYVKHNPFVFFNDVTGNQNVNSTYCINHERPFTTLTTDLAAGTQAQYNFITPNICDDGHDSCAPTNDPVKQTDNWLATNVPTILNSAAYKNGGALFITWDEGEGGSDGPIGMIVLSPYAKSGYSNSISYTHSSTLRTVEEIFGVSPMLGGAATSNDLHDLFTTFP